MAGLQLSANAVTITGVNATWAQQQTECFATVADVASSLQSAYLENDLYYIWYNVGAAGVDPAIAGKTGIEVALVADDSAVLVASKTVAAINAEVSPAFYARTFADAATGLQTLVVIRQVALGAVTVFTDGSASTGFTFEAEAFRPGSILEVGLLDGDVTFTIEDGSVDVTAQQAGATILARLRTGTQIANITVTALETTAARLRSLIEPTGHLLQVNSKDVATIGSQDEKLFRNKVLDSRALILHPSNLPASNRDEDFFIPLSFPNVSELLFSGENPRTLSIDFENFPDELNDPKKRVLYFGDWQQNLFA